MVCYSLEHKIIYIHVPKTGGMTIEKILIDNFGFKNFTFDNGAYEFLNKEEGRNGFFKYILKYSKEAKDYNLLSWRKFTFVRNPHSRCYSAIRYLSENYFKDKFPTNLMEFYEYCNNDNFFYIHFIMSQSTCLKDREDNIIIDYIGKFENFQEDLEHILFDCFGFERKDISGYHIHKTNPDMIEFDKELINKISNIIHSEDFENFNYQAYN